MLVRCEQNNPSDQDTYEQLMTMEDKEIRFWAKYPEFKIPYLEECGMNWDEILADYNRRMEEEKARGIDIIRKQYEEAIANLTSEDVDNFFDGELPESILKIVDITETGSFVCKTYPDHVIGSINDIIERAEVYNTEDD